MSKGSWIQVRRESGFLIAIRTSEICRVVEMRHHRFGSKLVLADEDEIAIPERYEDLMARLLAAEGYPKMQETPR